MRTLAICVVVLVGCFEVSDPPDFQAITDERTKTADGGMADAGEGHQDLCADADELGEACAVGVGQCERAGTMVCQDSEVVCDAEPGVSTDELCDSEADEDCDGAVDEAPEGKCCVDAECDAGETCDRLAPEVDPAKPGDCVPEENTSEDPCLPASKLANDPDNCGRCGRACASRLDCVDGECVEADEPAMACPSGDKPCGDTCIDEDGCCSDGDCSDTETCNSGACEPNPCAGVDTQTDDNNCGECGKVCEAGESCVEGDCNADPPECGGADPQTDDDNCGGCAEQCKPTWHCANGMCAAPDRLALGQMFTCRMRDGIVSCDGTHSATQIAPPAGRYQGLAVGHSHVCAIRESNSTVVCWGDNDHQQASAPTGKFKGIAAGEMHTCGIRMDGSVQCWGIADASLADAGQATAAATVATGLDFLEVAAGSGHSCALDQDGRILCWGDDSYEQVSGPNDAGTGFRQVVAGFAHTCGLRTDGQVRCWGYDYYNQVSGQDGADDYIELAAGYRFTCGLHQTGAITCWGDNSGGQTSGPNAAARMDFVHVAAGTSHVCVLAQSGERECWGSAAAWKR